MISSIVFLVVGGTFVFSLLGGLFKLLSGDFKQNGMDSKQLFSIFKWTIISLVILILFIMFGIPYMEANGLK